MRMIPKFLGGKTLLNRGKKPPARESKTSTIMVLEYNELFSG